MNHTPAHTALVNDIRTALSRIDGVLVGLLVSGKFTTPRGTKIDVAAFGPGTPDLVAIVYGRAVFIEAKTGGADLEPDQRRFQRMCGRFGYAPFVVARGVGDAVGAVSAIRGGDVHGDDRE